MHNPRGILLTGATGFLGSYLLSDLLVLGHRVTVLVRPSRTASAEERVAAQMARWDEALRARLPRPFVLVGDLHSPALGLSPADRRQLVCRCDRVVHAAASTTFQPTANGEPYLTNFTGTRHLLELCSSLGLGELHHISTAFVCGERQGPILESELDCGQSFHNAYEESKFAAERLLGQWAGIRTTIYRPSVIVGDSRTGFTSSYQGLYRFLEVADRLAEPRRTGLERRVLPLRLPFTGDERCDLVPVDWVAETVTRLLARPECHGRTYHFVASRPVLMRDIKEVAEELLQLQGVRCVGTDGVVGPNRLEELFQDSLSVYWSYLKGDPLFDSRNLRIALPQLPAPVLDRLILTRLIQFAIADDWGRAGRKAQSGSGPGAAPRTGGSVCRDYLETFFPEHARQSMLARVVTLHLVLAVDVQGDGDGQWTCRWAEGELVEIQRGLDERAEVVYRTDLPTFTAVVSGEQSPHEAFFAQRIAITGDVEKALKLALLFGQFIKEFPYSPQDKEVADVPGGLV